MGLLSFLRKNKQEPAAGGGEFYSRAEEDSQSTRTRGKRKSAKSANEPVDPVLPEKKRARRRLVGAVALVLAMVIGLPMLLDSEPKPLANDIAIQIPSRDKPASASETNASGPALSSASVSSASVSSTSSSAVVSQPTPANAADVVSPQTVTTIAQSTTPVSPAPRTTVATPPASPSPAVVPPSPPANTAVTTVKPKPTEAAKPTPAHVAATENNDPKPLPKETVQERQNDARAEALLDGRDVPSKPATEKKPGKFVVQVAALASQDKVTELQGKLTEAGFKSYVQKVPTGSGERIRVRIGPFGSKEEAESARAKLSKLGLGGTLMPS